MNVTELARKLRITPAKLRDIMPKLGFDIGLRAIKVDPTMAQAILEKLSDPKIRQKYLTDDVVEKPKKSVGEAKQAESKKEGNKVIQISERIVVNELSKRMGMPVTNLILELIKNGVMASLNQDIDFETASIIAEDLGFKVEKSEERAGAAHNIDYGKLLQVDKKNAVPRPPVVVVMGHVDHGKTKLLDAIRQTNIMEGEAGGITQHIGAYQVEKGGRLLTFIDTPGHEAFSAMRSRGAQVADIAILIVAADDGVQPQTIEAVAHIRQAGLPFIVAINKIDKPGVNIDKVKSDLANIGLAAEDWGGKTICVAISAKQNLHIDELLETLFLVADMESDKIVADEKSLAVGTIIESHIDKGEGPVATVLIHNGILKKGEIVKIGGQANKIRAMKNWKGEGVDKAMPSMPVKILGLKNVPLVGEILQVLADRKKIRKLFKNRKELSRLVEQHQAIKTEESEGDEEKKERPQVNLILKADVFGSIEAIIESLEKINQTRVELAVIKQGLGNITEKDVEQAVISKAYLLGFNVKITAEAKRQALEKNIEIQLFNVIYDLLLFVEEEIKQVAGVEMVEKTLGKLKVLKIFSTGKNWQIVGGRVESGKIMSDLMAKIYRGNELIEQAQVVSLEAGKEVVKEAVVGQECGVKIKGIVEIKGGDDIEVIKIEEK